MMKQRLFHRCFLFGKAQLGNNDETTMKQRGIKRWRKRNILNAKLPEDLEIIYV